MSFAVAISQSKFWYRPLFFLVPLICFLGYMGPGANIIFFMPAIMVMHIRLPVHSPLLIFGGRRERFWSALILAISITVLITTFATLAALISFPLASFMPDLTIKGQTLVFQQIKPNLFFVPISMIPLCFAISLIFHKKKIIAVALAVIIFVIFFNGMFFLTLRRQNDPINLNFLCITVMMLFNWAAFVAILRHICSRMSLVTQT